MTILWSVNPTSVQPPGVVEVSGVGSPGNITLVIQVPDGTETKVPLFGPQFSTKIYLNSGAGVYKFRLLTTCEVSPAEILVNADCCPALRTRKCNIKNLSPVQAIVDTSVPLRFSGFSPYEIVSIVINPGATNYSLQANAIGDLAFSHVFKSTETFTISVTSLECAAKTFGIAVLPVLTKQYPEPGQDCGEAVQLSYRLDKDLYDVSDAGSLTITMCNYNSANVVVTGVSLVDPPPAWLQFVTPPNFPATLLSGGQCKTLAFPFKTSGAGSVALKFSGNFSCGGSNFSTGAMEVPIISSSATPLVKVNVLAWVFNPSTISINSNSTLKLVINNAGTTIVHNITLQSGILPSGLGNAAVGFSGVTLLPGQTYTYEVPVTGLANGIYNVTLAPSDLTGEVNGSVMNLPSGPALATLTVV